MSRDDFYLAAENQDWLRLIAAIPYAEYLGMQRQGDIFCLPFADKHIGNSFIKALHGGVLAGFMENAALLHCITEQKQSRIPKPINLHIDYLRSGQAQDCYARCDTTRLGKRVANIAVKVWQLNESKPIAVARSHLLLE